MVEKIRNINGMMNMVKKGQVIIFEEHKYKVLEILNENYNNSELEYSKIFKQLNKMQRAIDKLIYDGKIILACRLLEKNQVLYMKCNDCKKSFRFMYSGKGPGIQYCKNCHEKHKPGQMRKKLPGITYSKYIDD